MKVEKIVKTSGRPKLYEPGNAVMWTDEHISKQLLDVHLSQHTDLASRKPETIKKTIEWVLSHCNNGQLNILDLGCGPGLYSEQLTGKGHRVTGVDFSANSINYAKSEANKKNLDITYLNQDYTKLNLPENQFDLVILIYTDFGPLLPLQREQLLKIVKKVLKPGGLFIFDVLNDTDIDGKVVNNSWEASEQGFWRNKPYLALSDSYFYENEKVVLYQHKIIDEEGQLAIYRFWNHFFSTTDLEIILENHGFRNSTFHKNIIPGGDGYKSEDVTFCVAENS